MYGVYLVYVYIVVFVGCEFDVLVGVVILYVCVVVMLCVDCDG